MRNIKPLVLTAVVLGVIGIILPASAAGKQARAKFKEVAWDFGKIKQGEILTHEFVFTNEGDAPLVIEKVSTSCGCTAALASEEKIGPGKEGRIKASFDSRGYSGRIVKYVTVESNDADASRRELSLTAEIEVPPQPRIELSAYNIDLGLSLEGEEASTRVAIKNTGELELSIDIAHPEFNFLANGKPAAFPLKIAAGKELGLDVRLPSQNKNGALRDYVLIKSNDPVRSTLSIYISRYVITKEALKELFKKYGKISEEKR
jgi:hypothetical protein